MRKRLISVCTVAILIFAFYRYVLTVGEILLVEEPTVEIKDDAEESSESAELAYIIQSRFTQDDIYETQDWQDAYAEYIESIEYAPYNKYALIYVDEDDIPELVINTNTHATACIVLTFHGGEVDALQTWNLQCNYIEKQNLYWDAGGHMGGFYDQVYTIENGKWVHAASGEYIAKELLIEEYDFAWEGKPVSEDEYFENLHAVYDMEKNLNVGAEQYERLDEMLFRLKTGTAMSSWLT